jgi:hypothetical protein
MKITSQVSRIKYFNINNFSCFCTTKEFEGYGGETPRIIVLRTEWKWSALGSHLHMEGEPPP